MFCSLFVLIVIKKNITLFIFYIYFLKFLVLFNILN